MTSIAVVMPVWNMRNTVLDAVGSVLGQSRRPDEFVVVDDGSDDGTADALLDLPGFRTLTLNRNRGTCPAVNAGVATTSSAWVMLVAADDRLAPEFLAELDHVASAVHDRVGVVSPELREFGERHGVWLGSVVGRESFWPNPPVPGPSAVRRAAFVQAGGYDAMFDETGGEDWDLWCELFERGWGFVLAPSMVYHYRVDSRPRRYNDPDLNALMRRRLRAKHPAIFAGAP